MGRPQLRIDMILPKIDLGESPGPIPYHFVLSLLIVGL